MHSGSGSELNMNAPDLPEEIMSLIAEAAPDAMLMTDAKGTIILVNAQAERLFGHTHAELLGKAVEALVPQRVRGSHPSQRRGFFHDAIARPMGAGRDLYGLHKDGREVPIEIRLNPVKTGKGVFVLASIIDMESYISTRTEADFTHGFRPECVERHFGVKLSSKPPPAK
jgi:PAS domain S-box-containing protein